MNIAVVLAGGAGIRIGGEIPKQYIEVQGKPIIQYCLEVFTEHREIDAVQIVADKEWQEFIYMLLKKEQMLPKWKGFSLPGQNRQLSILNALQDIAGFVSESDWVMIHDAARPCLTQKMITECLQGARGHDGVIPVLPMKDTVYYSQNGSEISKLLDRNCVFAGQAPEVFQFESYYKANKSLSSEKILQVNGSTEPAVLAGLNIAMIAGYEENYKITTMEDLKRFQREMEG